MKVSHYLLFILIELLNIKAAVGVGSEQQQPIQDTSENQTPFDHSFDQYVEDLLKQCHVPGLSIAIVEDGKISSKGYGFATLPDRKATADTQYFTASTTKAFTAAVAALIVHDNVEYPSIQWKSPINSVLRDDFVLEDEWATNRLTLEDALSHRTGLPGHDLFYGQPGDTPREVVRRLRYLPMTESPRSEWQYCNVMFAVMTHLIETLTGKPLETVLKKWIWEPLGMRSTHFDVAYAAGENSRLARGYYWNPAATADEGKEDGELIPERHVDLMCTAGDGATISTVNDYALWMRALINAAGDKESQNTSSPISSELFRDMVAPRSIIPALGFPDSRETFVPPLYALGWYTATILGKHFLYHSGGITGFGTEMVMLPGMKYGVVTMQNVLSTTDCDPGILVASRLLVEKLSLEDSSGGEKDSPRNVLLDTQTAARQAVEARRRRKSLSSDSSPLSSQSAGLPLPLPLSHFTGLYTHPAYGALNLTLEPSSSSSSPHVLSGVFHPRTEAEKEVLTHISGTLFSVQTLIPHGLGDIATGEGIVWENLTEDDDDEAYAVFELGADGESVDVLGIELDEDMIRVTRERGKYWKEGMIWFRRLGDKGNI